MLKDFFDKLKAKGGNGEKRSFLYTAAEAFETFFFVPNEVTRKGAHIRDSIDLKRTMTAVILALVPCMLFGIWNVGHQHYLAHQEMMGIWPTFWYGFLKVLPIIIVSYVVGLGIEFLFAAYRKEPVSEGFLVTGLLIPMVCPPDIPLWMVAVATAFSVVVAKEAFGGTGMNIWNPALVARAFLYFAYPSQLSGDSIWIVDKPDAFSGATPLASITNNEMANMSSWSDIFYGLIPGSIGETSALCIIIGAAILIFTGIGSARIMISAIVGALVMGLLANWALPYSNVYAQITPWQHLILGGFLFGVVFMATDPVTASQTPIGKLIYGFLIGFVAILIRVFNPAYPEGIMLAILLMNTFAPLIDHIVISFNVRKRLKRVNN